MTLREPVWREVLLISKYPSSHNRDLIVHASESIDDSGAHAWEVYSRRRVKDSVLLADDFVTRLHTKRKLLRLVKKIFEPSAQADHPFAWNFREIRRGISDAGG